MDPFERFHRRSLRDILISQGVLTTEQADELVDAAHQSSEPFGKVLLEAGYLTPWDLAKAVATHYQMPVLPLAGYRYDKELAESVPASVLFQFQILPVGRFGKTWTFAVVEPPARDLIDLLREHCGTSLFFFAADSGEVNRLLREHVKVVDVASDNSWQTIFDTADRSILGEQKSSPTA